MKRMTLIVAVVALTGTGAVIWQRQLLSEFQENENRRINCESVSANAEAPLVEKEVMALREQVKELPKLRNEVSQLRASQMELTKARAENARLMEAKRTGLPVPREAPPGFTLKEQLKDAGFATPEATVETFFWAMREGAAERWVQTLSPTHEDRTDFELLSPTERTQPNGSFQYGNNERKKMMEHFRDFTVIPQGRASEDVAALTVRSSANTNVIRFQLQRFGTEWKLSSYPDW